MELYLEVTAAVALVVRVWDGPAGIEHDHVGCACFGFVEVVVIAKFD